MRISDEFGHLIVDAMGGLTYQDAEIATGISSTYLRKMRRGVVPSLRLIARFCSGLGISEEPFVRASGRATAPEDPEKLLQTASVLGGLPNPDRLELLRYYRQLRGKESHDLASII